MGIFNRFQDDDIVVGNPTEVTVGLWSNDTGSLTAFYSSSTQASSSLSGQYYWNVYQTDPNNAASVPLPEVQFALAYGHRTGGGAPTLNDSDTATLSTKAVYAQYRNILLDPNDTQFTFYGNYNSEHIYVINIERARLKEKLDPGNWSLNISGTLGNFTFIDDSGQTLDPTVGNSGRVFNVVSGSLTGASGSTTVATASANFGGFGLVYPDVGIIVLNPQAISATVGLVTGSYYVSGSKPFAPNTGSSTLHQYNHAGLYNAIKLGGDFQARSAETISSTNFFVTLKAKDFNYSNNPSFFDETNGALIYNSFIKDPRVYPTTIGLYNDNNELLAVAKLSSATEKSFDRQLNIRIRLDF